MGQLQDIIDPPDRQVLPEQPRIALVVVLFFGSFALACSLLIALGHYGLNAPRSLWPFGSAGVASGDLGRDSALFDLIQVNRGGVYAKAAVSDVGNPTKGEPFALFVWFNLRKMPAVGESLGLLGKFDSQLPGKPGYAVSLEGAPDGVRPRVYIGAGNIAGRWYSFASHPMNRRDWYLLAVTVVEDAFIATSLGRALSAEPLKLLGGHRLTGEELPVSQADLVVGAFGASRFRGRVGPFGILAGHSSKEKFAAYLKAIQEQPGGIPSVIPADYIRLWASPLADLGPRRVAVLHVQGDQTADEKVKGEPLSRRAQVRPPSGKRHSKPLRKVSQSKKVAKKGLKDTKKR